MENQRRNFLKKSGLGLGMAASASHFSFDIIKSSKKEGKIVGQGDFKYRVDKQWGVQDPTKVPVKNCHEMVQDKKGRLILLTDETNNNLIFYDRSGKVLKTWGNQFPGAHGLTLWEEGGEEFLFITDTVKHQVYKTTLDGKVLMTIDYPMESGVYAKAEEFVPTETTIAPNGDIYIADGYGANYISVYDSKGNFKFHFGGKGQEDELFDCCHGITIDTRQKDSDTLLITSRSANQFKRFTLDGKHLETIDIPGMWPCRPVIKEKDLYFAIIVTNTWWDYDGFVAAFNTDNKLISAPGAITESNEDGTIKTAKYDGETFLSPHDVCIDNDLNIYVAQWLSGKTYPVMLERI